MNATSFAKRPLPAALVLLLSAALAGCGPGGGDSLAGGGIGGSGLTVSAVSVGAVSGFGSIIVNDVAYNDSVEGPLARITELDPLVTELVVMGQTVRVDERTVFRDASAASLVPGNLLEVSGAIAPDGVIFASYLRRKADAPAPGASVDLKGIVRNLNPAAGNFTVSALTVDYRLAVVSGFSGPDPEEGRLVEVSGRLIAPDLLEASRVAFENELGRDDVETVEIEGFITQFSFPDRFTVGTALITTDSATQFAEMSGAELVPGKRIRVRGALDGGVILADKVASSERVRLESTIAAVDAAGKKLSLAGLYTGAELLAVAADASTRYVGVNGFSQIKPGDGIKAFGRTTGSGGVIATMLLVKAPSDKAALAGPVEFLHDPVLRVVGVQVDTSAPGFERFFRQGAQAVSRREFFDALTPGDMVGLKGAFDGLSVAWSEAQLE